MCTPRILMALLVAIVLTVANAYLTGHRKGVIEGKEDTIKVLQPKIDALTNLINAEREAQTKKVHELEDSVAVATSAATLTRQTNNAVREKIVTQYKVKEIQSKCGLTKPTVDTINQLLSTQSTFEASK